mmetsp:Transcript_133090/g.336053  ORF Transcript_133090/g.336053 Transcript_133090/m.336053 type:complete len:206 (-) Transcript_133090:21-638(-)
MSGFFRGTSTDQVKCVNADQKLVKKLEKEGRFPTHFSKKVDMSKVSMEVLRPWITRRVTELLGFEDDIVVEFCITQLEEKTEKGVDPKLLQVNLTGFMERKAAPFCSELWSHLLSAQESPVGVPKEFIEQKKDELRQKREEAERVQEELKRRKRDLEEAQRGGGSDHDRRRRAGASPRRSRERSRSRSRSGSQAVPRRRERRRFE